MDYLSNQKIRIGVYIAFVLTVPFLPLGIVFETIRLPFLITFGVLLSAEIIGVSLYIKRTHNEIFIHNFTMAMLRIGKFFIMLIFLIPFLIVFNLLRLGKSIIQKIKGKLYEKNHIQK